MGIYARASRAVSGMMSLNVLIWLTMLTLFAGLLALAAAAYLALAAVLPPAIAALLAGAALLLTGLILALVTWRLTRQPHSQTAATSSDATTQAADASASPQQHATRSVVGHARNNPDIAIAAGLAAGVALTVSPALRGFVVRTAGPVAARFVGRAVRRMTDQ